ncbi:MAG: NAD(P)H-quinone oxidoreductase [Bacteroidota bacterium]
MKAILVKEPGGAEALMFGTWETPAPRENEVLVRVQATALNRADLLQRKGKYPPPPGVSSILGLEMAGVVEEVGTGVTKWRKGDKVCGLLSGGGYAEYALIHEDLALPIPQQFSMEEAAAIPEVFLTAYQALKWLSKLQPKERILIHAGASGVGTAAIQLARFMGAEVIVTASASKHARCMELGAALAIDYQSQEFYQKVMEYTDKKGVDVIIDFIAAPYFDANIRSLATDGRLIILALMGGVQLERFHLGPILRKRLHIIGSTLRTRDLSYKIALSQDLKSFAWPLFENGQIKPIIDSVFDWTEVANAHRYMEANRNKGKIVLRIN